MGWLSDWLKQVILVIMLAAFVDLLLPNQAMQRYVKAVVSLFLLLTLLTPVFELFQRGWDADRLIAEAERGQYGSIETAAALHSGGTGGRGLQSLDAILAESERVKADNQLEARKLAENRLAEEMKAGLEKATGFRVGELQAEINIDRKGSPAIGSVRVTLLHTKASSPPVAADGERERPGQVQVRVDEVKPVTIEIRPTAAAEAGDVKATAAAGDSAETGPTVEEARRFFQRDWQLPPERVSIRIIS